MDIIKIIHNKQRKNTGFTKPFDFTKYVAKHPYLENENVGIKLSSRKLEYYLQNHIGIYQLKILLS